jgi:hypothetical protein
MRELADICFCVIGIALLVLPFLVIPRLMKKTERNPETDTGIQEIPPGGF